MQKILIIDDEEDLARLTEKILRKNGYEVSCYFQGEKALDEARRVHPDLILLDIILPDISGIDIFKELRADKELSKIPVLFFSAIIKTGEVVVEELGAEGAISKPYEVPALLDIIKQTLANRKEILR